MTKFSEAKISTLNTILVSMKSRLDNCRSLEQAAQEFINTIYEEFEKSLVLARLFLSLPYATLPQFNKNFVLNLAEEKGIASKLKDDTPVLSLLGTRGAELDWNDRRKSKGHVGIPLVSAEFIEAIPMLSRLLNDLGLGLDWLEKPDEGLDVNSTSDISGIFFVRDGRESIDSKKRKIIPMQDFVESYNVRTVFGIGGRYMMSGKNIVVAIFFTKEPLNKDIAMLFQSAINHFKTSTVKHMRLQHIFSDYQ